jgi:hypothetical protein
MPWHAEDWRDYLDPEDVALHQAKRNARRNSCSDRTCGALDCYRCRGEDAVDYLLTEEEER